MANVRVTGKVKFFDDVRGFGFLVSDDGLEVFVHRTDLDPATPRNDEDRPTLGGDEKVSFEIIDNPRKSNGKKAARVQVV